MKIVFSKKADGSITATNSKVFKSFFINDFDNVNSDTKCLYAVINDKIIKVIVVNEQNTIKLMFEKDDKSYQRMYIEDKDFLFTTKEDAENYISRMKAISDCKDKLNKLNDNINNISKELIDKFNNINWNKEFSDLSNIFNIDYNKSFKKFNNKNISRDSLENEKKNLEKKLEEINNKLSNMFTEVE